MAVIFKTRGGCFFLFCILKSCFYVNTLEKGCVIMVTTLSWVKLAILKAFKHIFHKTAINLSSLSECRKPIQIDYISRQRSYDIRLEFMTIGYSFADRRIPRQSSKKWGGHSPPIFVQFIITIRSGNLVPLIVEQRQNT